MIPECRLGGPCELFCRDPMLVAETDAMVSAVGIYQCLRCSMVYEATGFKLRSCDHCHMEYGESIHDPCLGHLEGVVRACCGHGNPAHAYRAFADGTYIDGIE